MDNKIKYIEIFNGVVAPAILYKYRSFHNKRHQNILLKRELYLASPNDFEDKKDCNLDVNIPPREQLFNEYMKHLPPELRNAPVEKQIIYARDMEKNGLFAHPEELRIEEDIINTEQNRQRGVLSLTKRWDNEYMWENYGDRQCGFCVGFNTKALIDTNQFGGGGEVIYYEELPQLSCDRPVAYNIADNLLAKKIEYENEEEYRLLKIWNHIPTIAERTIVIPSNCFECIIMGKEMTESDKVEMRRIQMAYLPNVTLYELIDE